MSRLQLPTGVSGGVAAAAGAGAAGGMGFALMGVCGAVLKNGFDIVAGIDWNLIFLTRLNSTCYLFVFEVQGGDAYLHVLLG